MNDPTSKLERAQSPEAAIVKHPTPLLMAGDRVTIPAEDVCVYRIVHVSQQKAWVAPVRAGRQRIIHTRALRLVRSATSATLN